jgi:hypothetical protein
LSAARRPSERNDVRLLINGLIQQDWHKRSPPMKPAVLSTVMEACARCNPVPNIE